MITTYMNLMMQSEPWHRQGLYMGMHWAWWLFWVGAVAMVLWAFWRLVAERKEGRRRTHDILAAEEVLRNRFARGEIGEAEFADGMQALRSSRS